MIIRYPAESELRCTMDGVAYEPLGMIPGIQVRLWAYTAKGFRGFPRWYMTSITEEFGSPAEMREVQEDCARMSLEDLLLFEYRNPQGRWMAAWRDVKRALWGKVPRRVKFIWARISWRFEPPVDEQ